MTQKVLKTKDGQVDHFRVIDGNKKQIRKVIEGFGGGEGGRRSGGWLPKKTISLPHEFVENDFRKSTPSYLAGNLVQVSVRSMIESAFL